MKKVVFMRRVTVFLKQTVNCSESTRIKVSKVFPNARISPNVYVAPLPIRKAPPLPDGEPWILNDEKTMGRDFIGFGPNRIDFTSRIETTDEPRTVEGLLETLKKVTDCLAITEYTRLAYHPCTAVEEDEDFNVGGFFGKHLTLPDYDGCAPKGRNIQVTYQVERSFGDKTLPINVVTKLVEGEKTERRKEELINTTPSVIVDNDINTANTPDTAFSHADLTTFLTAAISWHEEIVKIFCG